MKDRRTHRQFSRVYDDGFRSGIASTAALLPPIGAVLLLGATDASALARLFADATVLLPLFCGYWVSFSAIYLVWTHVLFARTDPHELRRIADIQHHRRASPVEIALGLRGATGVGAVSVALVAMAAAVGTALVGVDATATWRVALVLLTVAASWVGLVYTFALRYLRLDAAQERISFDIDEEPGFGEFVSMAVLVSAVGALSGGTPRTRAGLSAVRAHTVFAFVFNTVIVAMTVSLAVGLVSA
ncbi:DUF1345 domain-containing protein [Streptomyces sp. AC495_CC817]|uniref:DUF1345 domain-containing protein n=1 Tax=Streptomyces sp. AC495_CC817 TaxID=2823900 RepID=UPI001C25D69A|nr:DUF1345 domain-containing protein [Streptomyces sp. AC495_CC817]